MKLAGWLVGWEELVVQTNLELRNERIVPFYDNFHKSRIVYEMVGKQLSRSRLREEKSLNRDVPVRSNF